MVLLVTTARHLAKGGTHGYQCLFCFGGMASVCPRELGLQIMAKKRDGVPLMPSMKKII